MNPEQNNNIDNTQTNLENIQPNIENTQTNIEIDNPQVGVEQTTQVVPPVENNIDVPPIQVTASTSSLDPLQPVVVPTESTGTSEGTKISDEEKKHSAQIPDESSKKDFVIKSKKETVAEETKMREAKIEEHVRKANENYVPNSKTKNILLVFFLVFIILFTVFLPDIRSFVIRLQSGSLKPEEEIKITKGVLKCTYKKSNDSLDYEYKYDFIFNKNLLKSYDLSLEVKGDASLDKEKLDKLKSDCKTMKNESEKIEGIEVSCDSKNNSSKYVLRFDLGQFKSESITPAYTEAGGEAPSYRLGQDMDDLEKNMYAAGYTCKRVATS